MNQPPPLDPPDFRRRSGQTDAALALDLFALRIAQVERESGK